jgi:hypothetical protein
MRDELERLDDLPSLKSIDAELARRHGLVEMVMLRDGFGNTKGEIIHVSDPTPPATKRSAPRNGPPTGRSESSGPSARWRRSRRRPACPGLRPSPNSARSCEREDGSKPTSAG